MSRKDKILTTVLLINIFATLYVAFVNPKREDKLFELYFASVSSLYGGLLLQQRSGDRQDDSYENRRSIDGYDYDDREKARNDERDFRSDK